MITRDNKESISGTAQNARQRFGEVLKHYRLEREIPVREVARRCKVPVGAVEKWESGEQLPNSDEWKALCRGINRALNAFHDLYQRARAEADEASRARAQTNMKEQKTVADTRPNNPSVKIGTPLADKLAPALTERQEIPKLEVVPNPPPAPNTAADHLGQPVRGFAADGRKLLPLRPAGASTSENVARRKDFVRDLLKSRPRIRTQGADSVVEAVRKAFGIGISPDSVDEIREELKREQIKAEIMRELPPPTPPTLPAMAAQIVEHVTQAAPTLPPAPVQSAEPSEADVGAAVQLILGALPGLQTFTIHVDEHGEAHVDYQIRKITVTTQGGSIKVRR